MASPFLYFAHERLSHAELTAARLDGDVVELGDAFIPADAVETTALRAGSLSRILGDALAATHLSAAWVHGALAFPPSRHSVQRAVRRRIHPLSDRHVIYRDLMVPAEDLQWIGGVRVTTVLRTLLDLARTPDDGHARAARLVAAAYPDALPPAVARLEDSALPYKRRALVLLRRAADGQLDVTRYTS